MTIVVEKLPNVYDNRKRFSEANRTDTLWLVPDDGKKKKFRRQEENRKEHENNKEEKHKTCSRIPGKDKKSGS